MNIESFAVDTEVDIILDTKVRKAKAAYIHHTYIHHIFFGDGLSLSQKSVRHTVRDL